MRKNKIKCVVLDFDNTLYSNGKWGGENDFYERFLIQENLIPGVDKKAEYLLKKYPQYHILQAIFAHMHEHNLSDEPFRKFEATQIYNMIKDDTVFIDSKILKELSKKYKVYMLSDSSREWLDHYMDIGGIDKSVFEAYNLQYQQSSYHIY